MIPPSGREPSAEILSEAKEPLFRSLDVCLPSRYLSREGGGSGLPCEFKFAGAQGLQDTNTEMLYPSLTYAVILPGWPRKVATKIAAATNAATYFLLIPKQLDQKVAR